MSSFIPNIRSHRPEDVIPPPRILIVDDDKEHVRNVTRILRDPSRMIGKLSCEIFAAHDLAEARSYLLNGNIDIYILDLELPEHLGLDAPNIGEGKMFVRAVTERAKAGVIICSSSAAELEASDLLEAGADDYVEKNYGVSTIPGRILSVWRRVLQSRPSDITQAKHANVGRVFEFGHWRFEIGSRTLIGKTGEQIKVTPTEHAFFRYICSVSSHQIDTEILNIDVLDRDAYQTHVRLDNFVYRLRKKFGNTLELLSQGDGTYKLLDVKEIS